MRLCRTERYLKSFLALSIALFCFSFLSNAGFAAGKYQNFATSIYARVYEVRQMKDRAWLEPRWNEISRQVKIDKIYLETEPALFDGIYQARKRATAQAINTSRNTWAIPFFGILKTSSRTETAAVGWTPARN
jgi:hypothetical protein